MQRDSESPLWHPILPSAFPKYIEHGPLTREDTENGVEYEERTDASTDARALYLSATGRGKVTEGMLCLLEFHTRDLEDDIAPEYPGRSWKYDVAYRQLIVAILGVAHGLVNTVPLRSY